MNLEQHKTQYINEKRAQGLSSHSVEGYEGILNDFLRYSKDKKINKDTYTGYINEKINQKRKPSTIRHYSLTIRGFLLWLAQKGELKITKKQLTPYKAKPPKINVLDKQQVDNMIAQVKGNRLIDKRNRAILLLLSTSGLRASELCGLNQNSISIDNDGNVILNVRGKGEKDRIAYTTYEAYKAIDMYLHDRQDKSDAMFVATGTEARIDRFAVRYIVNRYGKKAGLNIKPHDLRHYTATRLLAEGASTSVVQKVLGHRFISTTARYSHLSIKDVGAVYRQYMK